MEILTLVKANIKRRKGAFIAVVLLTAIIVASTLSIFNFTDSMDKTLKNAFRDIDDPTVVCFINGFRYEPELEQKVKELDIVKDVKIYDALRNWYNDGISNRVGDCNDGNTYMYMKLHDGIKLINSDESGLAGDAPKLGKGEVYLPLGVKPKLKCNIGDTLKVSFYYEVYEFTIKGFVQEPQNGSQDMGWKQAFISDEDFDKISRISEKTKADPKNKNDEALQRGIESKIFNVFKSCVICE